MIEGERSKVIEGERSPFQGEPSQIFGINRPEFSGSIALKVARFFPPEEVHTFASRIVFPMVTMGNTILEGKVWTFFSRKNSGA